MSWLDRLHYFLREAIATCMSLTGTGAMFSWPAVYLHISLLETWILSWYKLQEKVDRYK